MQHAITLGIQPNPAGTLRAVLSARSADPKALTFQLNGLESAIRGDHEWPLDLRRIVTTDPGKWSLRYRIQQVIGTHSAHFLAIEDRTRLGRDGVEVRELLAYCARHAVQVLAVADTADLTSRECE